MLFKFSAMFLSNSPNFSLLCPSYVPLCPTMLHKMLLPEFEDQPISLTTFISKQLRLLNYTFSTTAEVIMLIILYIVLIRIFCGLMFCMILKKFPILNIIVKVITMMAQYNRQFLYQSIIIPPASRAQEVVQLVRFWPDYYLSR